MNVWIEASFGIPINSKLKNIILRFLDDVGLNAALSMVPECGANFYHRFLIQETQQRTKIDGKVYNRYTAI